MTIIDKITLNNLKDDDKHFRMIFQNVLEDLLDTFHRLFRSLDLLDQIYVSLILIITR